MSVNLTSNHTSRLPSVVFEGFLAPFGPSEGFQGSGHMDSLTNLGVICSTLSHDLVKVVCIILWYLV